MGSNELPVKKIYIDSQFRRHDSVSTSNFKIELPYTLKLPDNTIFYVDTGIFLKNTLAPVATVATALV